MKRPTLKLWMAVPVVLALLVAAPLRADDGVSNTVDPATGLPGVAFDVTPLPDNDPVYNVLWDLSNGVNSLYVPSARYSDLLALLAANGYVTTTTTAGVDNIDLSPYDIIIVTTMSAWDFSYTAPEVAAIQDFMSQGGAVLVMGENADCTNEHINPVTQAFGVTCGLNTIDPLDLYFTDFAAHQIFDGVTTIYYRAAGELSASDPGVPLAWTDAGELTIASVGPCRMIVLGDCNFCDNTYLVDVDNEQFVLNVFDCLATGTSPVEDSTWGTVKAMYR